MSDYILLKGPDYQAYHTNFSYEIEILEYPLSYYPGTTDLTFYFYKNDKLVQEGGSRKLNLYDAEAPAAGVYTAKVRFFSGNVGTTKTSNSITLEMGSTPKPIDIEIENVKPIIKCDTGDIIELKPVIKTNVKNTEIVSYWEKDGKPFPNPKSDFTLQATSPDDSGLYTLFVQAKALYGSYKETNTQYDVLIKVLGEGDYLVNIHDLNPGRNAGFAQVGYWITDEIKKANDANIDWTDPGNTVNLPYNDWIDEIAKGVKKWPDLEIQESRNGYILHTKDLVKEVTPL